MICHWIRKTLGITKKGSDVVYKFSDRSVQRMQGVHPDLIRCAEIALSYGEMDITVLKDGGVRTIERQKELKNSGASKTLNSKHLLQDDGFGYAIDLAPYPIDWNDIRRFEKLGKLMLKASKEVGINLKWGGEWRSFKDYPHFEIKS